jgi:alanyl-tRNA synthetase
MKTQDLRRAFLDYYRNKGHVVVPGVSTIPSGDATILFTIAGMTPFKDVLAGRIPRKHARVANSQKCIRAADLEDVGLDGRHLTMFEMLGLWSFGDYFKTEAITWSHEFISQILKLDMSRIWVSVHDSDAEAAEIWEKVGIPKDRIVRLGDKDNFWAMGPTGPCGPCTEIYFDQGPSVGCEAGEGPTPGALCRGPGCDCDRYLEFWNNVFMQYNRDESGTLHPLPARNVDTGVGLERLAAICQGKTSTYDTDAFDALQRAVCHKAGLGTARDVAQLSVPDRQSVQVISDHMRTLVIALSDGATFSNEGRGYVLRRILRRAVRYAHRLQENHGQNSETPFLYRIAEDVAQSLGDFYPELHGETHRVSGLIHEEEGRFLRTLSHGLTLFRSRAQETLKRAPGHSAQTSENPVFPGSAIFELHDSYGFPVDLTALLCREWGLVPDLKEFDRLMEEQKTRSRAHSKFYDSDEQSFTELQDQAGKKTDSRFVGYHLPPVTAFKSLSDADMAAYIAHSKQGDHRLSFAEWEHPADNVLRFAAKDDMSADVVFAETPFYPEGGGQLADKGLILFGETQADVFVVMDVQKSAEGIRHRLERLSLGPAKPWANMLRRRHRFLVDTQVRRAIARHHSATHLLHAALRMVLGDHVRQAGSQVSPDGLRFDFTHPRALSDEELVKVEQCVQTSIDESVNVVTHESVPLDDAKRMGALAMFGEKYDDHVRVLEMGPLSMELCGGTHVANTAQIGSFRIVSESSVTSGVRRIEAVAGLAYDLLARHERQLLQASARILKCSTTDLPGRVEALREQERTLTKRLQDLEGTLHAQASSDLENLAEQLLENLRFLAHNMKTVDTAQAMEGLADTLRQKIRGVVVLGALVEGKAQLLVTIHQDVLKLYPKLSAGDLVRVLATSIQGRGGGKADFAKAGGTHIDGLADALHRAKQECLTLASRS